MLKTVFAENSTVTQSFAYKFWGSQSHSWIQYDLAPPVLASYVHFRFYED